MGDEPGGAERRLIEEIRRVVRGILLNASGPMPTTEISAVVGRVPYHLVYRTLVALERAGEVRRAGRVGTSASSEVLWRAVFTDSEVNPEFERLCAELAAGDEGPEGGGG